MCYNTSVNRANFYWKKVNELSLNQQAQLQKDYNYFKGLTDHNIADDFILIAFALIHPSVLSRANMNTNFSVVKTNLENNYRSGWSAGTQCDLTSLTGDVCHTGDDRIQAGHKFPDILGGLACRENCISLCQTHNIMFTNNIYLLFKEDILVFPNWLKNVYASI